MIAVLEALRSRAETAERGESDLLPTLASLWATAASVPDPEIPVLSVTDLGILRGLEWDEADPGMLVVTVTPTYSGCPATETINASLHDALHAAGARRVRFELRLAPAWTTEWITGEGRRKLAAFGIAPPVPEQAKPAVATIDVSRLRRRERGSTATIACPRCGSTHTQLLSQFGSTACKAHYRCLDCVEPFDYFKPH